MKGLEFTIRFITDKVYITESKSLKLEQTSLHISNRVFISPVYWSVRVLAHIPEEKRLLLEVVSYDTKSYNLSDQQLSYSSILVGIERLSFRGINTNRLLNTLNSTTYVNGGPSSMLSKDNLSGDINNITESNNTFKRIIEESFFVPIKSLKFKQGGVIFEWKLKDTKKKLEYEIRNNDIIEEFDAIKNYFANVLKTKKVEVFVTAEVLFGAVTPIKVSSPEITKIDRSLIEDVKLETLKATTRRNFTVHDESILFTSEEYFKTFGEENFKPSIFYKEDKELLKDFVKISETKHHKHLSYLSRHHDSESIRLRIIHKPLSFIFLIKKEMQVHFIWETLDTEEATYIWHFPKDKELRFAFEEVKAAIKIIKENGKTYFLSQNHEHFTRINHNYKEEVDGFIEWKSTLEEILV